VDAAAVLAIVKALLGRKEPALLVPKGPWNAGVQEHIAALAATSDPEKALKGALFLWNDDLWACHDLVQKLPDEQGAYLHAVLHRREPDAGNAKYWFARVGEHPLHGALLEAARELAKEGPDLGEIGRSLATLRRWDCARAVDWTEMAGREEEVRFLRALQALEIQGLAYAGLDACGLPRP
jgi:hypothetical protein